MTFTQRTFSARMKSPKACGVVSLISAPSSATAIGVSGLLLLVLGFLLGAIASRALRRER